MNAQHTPGPQLMKLDVKHPGIYASVNLNGFTLASHRKPSDNADVILGYRVPHLPEVWFGVGYRRDGSYWLGARGLDPNYDHLNDDQVVIWRPHDRPFCFDDGRTGTSSYLQYRYVVGDAPWQTEECWCALHKINGLQEPRQWRDMSTPRQEVWFQLSSNLASVARENVDQISKAAAAEKAEAAARGVVP